MNIDKIKEKYIAIEFGNVDRPRCFWSWKLIKKENVSELNDEDKLRPKLSIDDLLKTGLFTEQQILDEVIK
jgi:hypothetical protein